MTNTISRTTELCRTE